MNVPHAGLRGQQLLRSPKLHAGEGKAGLASQFYSQGNRLRGGEGLTGLENGEMGVRCQISGHHPTLVPQCTASLGTALEGRAQVTTVPESPGQPAPPEQ